MELFLKFILIIETNRYLYSLKENGKTTYLFWSVLIFVFFLPKEETASHRLVKLSNKWRDRRFRVDSQN